MSWELLDSAHLSPLEMVSMIELVLERCGDLTPTKTGWITGVELTPAKKRNTMGIEHSLPQRKKR